MNGHYHLPILLLALATSPIAAQQWTGAVDADWNDPSNWSSWPLDDEDLVIDPAFYSGAMASPVIASNSVFTPERVFVLNGAALLIQADLTLERLFVDGDGSTITMQSGTLTTQRLIAEMGGHFEMNGGMANVTSVVALGDDGDGPSTMVLNGGTMSVSGEFGFDVVLGTSFPLFQVNDGALTVNGEAIWYSEAPGGGRATLRINGGGTTINGAVSANAGGPLAIHLELVDGTLTVNGPIIDMPHAVDSIKIIGGDLHLAGTLVLENDGVLHAEAGTVHIDQQAELRGVGGYLFHHLDISADAGLTHTDPAEIQVSGHWMEQGAFLHGGNTVAFIGPEEQQVEGSTFHGLRIAGAGLQLNTPVGVAGELALINGIVHSDDDALLTVLDGATVSGGSDESHIDGPMRKIGDDDFVFPIGKDGSLHRIGIADIDDDLAEFTAEYFAFPYSNTTALGPSMLNVSDQEYWSLQRSGTSDDAIVTLYWANASASGLTSCDGIVVSHWDGALWQGTASTTNGDCAGTGSGSVTTNEHVPVYDVFTLGTADENVGLRLPHLTPIGMFHDPLRRQLRLQGNDRSSELMVFDARGAIVLRRSLPAHARSIDLPDVSAGLLIARLYCGNDTVDLRFVAGAQ